jgi:hypothetical protein
MFKSTFSPYDACLPQMLHVEIGADFGEFWGTWSIHIP